MKETITYRGIELEVEFDYQPREEEVRYDSNMEGYPGSPEYFDITGVFHEGESIWELVVGQLEEIEEVLIPTLRDDY